MSTLVAAGVVLVACADDEAPRPGEVADETVPPEASEPAAVPDNAVDTGTRTDTTQVELTDEELAELGGADPDGAADSADDAGTEDGGARSDGGGEAATSPAAGLTCLEATEVAAVVAPGEPVVLDASDLATDPDSVITETSLPAGGLTVVLETNLAGDSPTTYQCQHVVVGVAVVGYSTRVDPGRITTSTGEQQARGDLGEAGFELREPDAARCVVTDGERLLVEVSDLAAIDADSLQPGLGASCVWADTVYAIVADTLAEA